MKTIVVEGWRFIPHSYAMVNQYQCLELLTRADVRLFHRDAEYFLPQWRPTSATCTPEQERRLRAVPAPPSGLRPDVHLRMGFPLYFENDPAATRTFTWATCEFRMVEDAAIGVHRPAASVLPTIESTVIVPSRWAAEGFVTSGAPSDRVKVVPCGVDTTIFRPLNPAARAAARSRLGWDGRFVVLNVSAMTDNKGIGHLYGAVAAAMAKIPNIAIALKGTDELYPSQMGAAAALQATDRRQAEALAPRLMYLGMTLTPHELAAFYQAADLYVSPYLAEGFNLPVLEAAACGLPVICTRGGATDDFVDDSFAWRIDSRLEDGLVPGGTVVRPSTEHLTQLLIMLAGDASLRERAAKAGLEWVNSRYTWKHSVDRLLATMFPDG